MAKVTKIKLVAVGAAVGLAAVAVLFSSGNREEQAARSSPERKSDITENLLSLKALKAYASDAEKRQKEIEAAIEKLKQETEALQGSTLHKGTALDLAAPSAQEGCRVSVPAAGGETTGSRVPPLLHID